MSLELERLHAATFANAVAVKELRASLRRPRFVVLHTICLVVLGLAVMSALAAGDVYEDYGVGAESAGLQVFIVFVALLFGVAALVFPSFGTGAVVEEKVAQSYDLLVTTTMPPWEIALGKYLASLAAVAIYLSSTLPLACVCFLYGGVPVWGVLASYAGVFLASALLIAYAIFISSMAATPARAVAATYTFVLLVGFSGLPMLVHLFVISALRGVRPDAIAQVLLAALPPGAVVYASAASAFGYLALLAYFALLTINRLSPFSTNRSTPLRLYSLAVCAGLTLFFLAGLAFFGREFPPGGAQATGLGYTALLGFLLVSSAVAFSAEEPLRTGRVRARLDALSGPRRLLAVLYPGGWRGMAWSLGLALALLAGLACACLAIARGLPGPEGLGLRTRTIFAAGALIAMAFVFFAAQLSFLLSRVSGSWLRGRGIATALLLVLTLLPVVAWQMGDRNAAVRTLDGTWLSPLLSMASAGTSPVAREGRRLRLGGLGRRDARAAVEAVARGEEPADEARIRALADSLERGLPVHVPGIVAYALLGWMLLLLNIAGWGKEELP